MAFAFFDAPHAAAMTMLTIGVLWLVAAVQFFFLDKRTHYQ
jgi:sn-glycerol 3-phosphate transport system permease protein